MAMAIARANAPVATMDDQFAALGLRDLPRPVDRIGLPAVNRGGTLPPGRLHRPAARVRYDMLVSSRHQSSPRPAAVRGHPASYLGCRNPEFKDFVYSLSAII